MTTLDKPFHSVRKPSARDIVIMAFEMPLYMALGEGFTICMRVFWLSAHCLAGRKGPNTGYTP